MERLKVLRKEISELEAVKCQMYHEKMKLDVASNLFLLSTVPNVLFERVVFCSLAVRKQRIACAHTNARYLLREALSLLQKQDSQNSTLYDKWWQALNQLEDSMHNTDHQKGDLEKEYAVLWNSGQIEEARNLASQIKELEKIHSDCVDQIDRLRYDIIHEIDAVIT